jgi:gluconate 2-dehydrogenase
MILTMRPSVLVTRRVYPEAIEFLKQHADVEYLSSDEVLSTTELLDRARGKQAIISQLVDKFTRDVIAQLDPNVRVIANVAVGFDNIDVPAATDRRILVTNTPDILTDTTADFAFALLMAAARRIVEAHEFVHSGKWSRWTIDMLVGQDIHHRTLGILGMGRIGQAMARRGTGFSMRVIYHDASPMPTEAEYVSKERVLRESDFISVHVPLNDATRHYIGEPELRMMKPTAILINTSRGPVVDEAALAGALRENVIGGAGIDVFEREPTVHPDLLACRNAVLAPHIGSSSVETRKGMSMIAARNAVAALQGKQPANLLNPDAF